MVTRIETIYRLLRVGKRIRIPRIVECRFGIGMKKSIESITLGRKSIVISENMTLLIMSVILVGIVAVSVVVVLVLVVVVEVRIHHALR